MVLQGRTYGAGFLIMINYIYNQIYLLAGWFVRGADCEELVGSNHREKFCVWVMSSVRSTKQIKPDPQNVAYLR